MAELERRQQREIKRHLLALSGDKGCEPMTLEAVRRLGRQYLSRELRLSDGRALLLNDRGLEWLSAIDRLLVEADQFLHVEQFEISRVLRDVIAESLSNGQMPEDSQELIRLMDSRFNQMRHRHWFAVPVNGLEFDGIASVQLGDMKLVKLGEKAIVDLGATPSDKLDTAAQLGPGPCLVGSVFGTEAYAKREFQARGELVIGVLALVSAMYYEAGAAPFRITFAMSPDGVRGVSKYVLWHEDKPDVTHVYGWSERQTLRLNSEMKNYLETAPYIQHALALATRDDLSILEMTVLRALFWYSDAQRDTVTVMQLVKYWSCAEAIFSGDGKEVTKTVSGGVAGLLVFGGFHFKPVEEYADLVRQLTALYSKRSKAVHSAQHRHVSRGDIATLSQWSAYMLLTILAMIKEQGYTQPSQITIHSRRLAEAMARSQAHLAGTDTEQGADSSDLPTQISR